MNQIDLLDNWVLVELQDERERAIYPGIFGSPLREGTVRGIGKTVNTVQLDNIIYFTNDCYHLPGTMAYRLVRENEICGISKSL